MIEKCSHSPKLRLLSLLLALSLLSEQSLWATTNLVPDEENTLQNVLNEDTASVNQNLVDNHQAVADLIQNQPVSNSSFDPTQGYASLAANQTSNTSTYLLTSYPDASGLEDQAATYDQAVAGMAFLEQGDYTNANKILDFFKANWDGTGFWTFYNTQDPNGTKVEQLKILGPNAWIGIFCVRYFMKTGDQSAIDLAKKIAVWISTLPGQNGARATGADNPGTTPNFGTIFSTENNLDYYALLDSLNKILPSSDSDKTLFTQEQGALKNWFTTYAYNSGTGLFRRGINDPNQALDVNSWALLVFGAQTLQSDFGINIDTFMSQLESTFAVKNNGTFGGNVDSSCDIKVS